MTPASAPPSADQMTSIALLVRKAFGTGAIAYAGYQQAAFATAGDAAAASLWGAILARLAAMAAAEAVSPAAAWPRLERCDRAREPTATGPGRSAVSPRRRWRPAPDALDER